MGEIDLVCHKRGLLVVCEVKTRSSDRFGTGLEAVGPAKQARLRRLAGLYLAGYSSRSGEHGLTVRFDVAAVGPGDRLVVVEDAF